MNANKKICLDEVSVRLLRSLKSERQKLGITQEELGKLIGATRSIISTYEVGYRLPTVGYFVKLAEFFGYDLSSSVNYKYWHGQIEWWKLREQLRYYGFTCGELSDYIGYCKRVVCAALHNESDFSLDCLNAILEIFEDERRLLKFRNELLCRNPQARREWWKRTKSPAKPNSGSRDIWSWPF